MELSYVISPSVSGGRPFYGMANCDRTKIQEEGKKRRKTRLWFPHSRCNSSSHILLLLPFKSKSLLYTCFSFFCPKMPSHACSYTAQALNIPLKPVRMKICFCLSPSTACYDRDRRADRQMDKRQTNRRTETVLFFLWKQISPPKKINVLYKAGGQ